MPTWQHRNKATSTTRTNQYYIQSIRFFLQTFLHFYFFDTTCPTYFYPFLNKILLQLIKKSHLWDDLRGSEIISNNQVAKKLRNLSIMSVKSLFYLSLFAITFIACSDSTPKQNTMPPKPLPEFDWQGHRGARGLVPENTVPAFLKALSLNVRTLEMDAAISQNGDVIISHEPWFSHEISTTPDGQEVSDENEKNYLLHQMTTEDIQAFDVGSRGNARFPEQQKMTIHKPTLNEVVGSVNSN